MKVLLQMLLVSTLILIGGCQMNTNDTNLLPKDMDPEDLPDERAFEEEFTRGFLQSTKETRSGYYHFLSKTGKYEMDFPADGAIGKGGYALDGDKHEGFGAGVGFEDSVIKSSMSVMYNDYKTSGHEESFMKTLSDRVGNPLEFESIEADGQTLYIAYFQYEENVFGYAGYLQNEEETGGIDLIYRSTCLGENNECEELKESELKRLYDWMLSVKFINSSRESE